jgi:hypothetical protein
MARAPSFAESGINQFATSSPPTTMRSTTNDFARHAALGGGQTVGLLEASLCATCSGFIVQAITVLLFALGGRKSRDPGLA